MAATDRENQALGAVLSAALALPGVLLPAAVRAEGPPEHTTVSFKQLSYRDWQPDMERIKVSAPSVSIAAPLGDAWSVEASAVNDAVSGASPRYYTSRTGASRMSDNRTAGDVKVTRYQSRSAYALSLSHSGEHDYVSDAVGLDARFSSDDNNTTFNVGVGGSKDDITATGYTRDEFHGKRYTAEFMAGVTQAMSPRDLMQLNMTYSNGHGHYSDIYKGDNRPNSRRQMAALLRWNHHFEEMGATLRTSYRYYRDSWKLRSHTWQAEWVQPFGNRYTLTPLIRYYTQNAASFYVDPEINPVSGQPHLPASLDTANEFTSDQRLSAFGAVTVGLKAAVRLDHNWSADVKLEYMEQRASWRVGGQGSPGLQPFKATSLQWGASKVF